ncbi:transglycosylase domain-containing protein [Oceanibacterium hippocampi]|uniref:Penicillin-binding protein 2D n=1 Tax=Oceanibacterium hippocampi TaxID=745714 RepID=A0A1Y5RSB9_9PROT|nr:PBP1A family penicillin-binding protein [Oceanibacterium hippocampi]SLN21480.1 Penicillin-binding protein 2D [Oceanibacterium hippocampi]
MAKKPKAAPTRKAKAGRTDRKKTPRTSVWRRLFWLARFAAIALIWLAVAGFAILAFYAYDLPDVEALESPKAGPALTLLAEDGSTVAHFGRYFTGSVPLSDMPPYLPIALLATEDRRFYSHFGVDPIGLLRAALANYRAGRVVQGGSTITQQLAKNLYLSPERTVRRKIQEVVLALWLEVKYTKDEILALYLNRVYFGAGAYGVGAAAARYFDKDVGELTLGEAAMLAGLVKAPSRYAPTSDLALARARAEQVLANMVDAGFISDADAKRGDARRIKLSAPRDVTRNTRYFADWIVDELADYISTTDDDLVIVTTLDPAMQRAAEAAVAATLGESGKKQAIGQGALLAMTPDGAVRAMVGGRDYAASSYNRAVSARRQPGSAFKLFVYTAALENGMRPSDRVVDGPISIDGWKPKNYRGDYKGEMTLKESFSQSVNTVAVQLSERAGRKNVIDAAERLGIRSELRNHPSIALGTSEVSLLELTAAYGTVAADGRAVLPFGIVEIRGAESGRVLYRRRGSGLGRVVDRRIDDQLRDMLRSVIVSGTGRGADPGRPAAGKTGTSQDFRDAWFIGFTPELVAGVWFGNDDASPMKNVTGGGAPARTWGRFVRAALEGKPVHDFDAGPLLADGGGDGDWRESIWQTIRSAIDSAISGGGNAAGSGSAGSGSRTAPANRPAPSDFPADNRR